MRSFVLGFLLGAATLYGSMCFHVVQSDDGYHVVAKSGLSFRDTYVDVRKFGLSDWRDHVGLAEALLKAGKGNLLGETAQNSVRNVFDDLLSGRSQ